MSLRGSTSDAMHTVMGSELTVTPQEQSPDL